jgi:hypothetical protein
MQDQVAVIKLRRTGRVYSLASSEFSVTYPDGSEGVVWSPPWHEMSPEEEESAARQYAMKLYAEGSHVSQS